VSQPVWQLLQRFREFLLRFRGIAEGSRHEWQTELLDASEQGYQIKKLSWSPGTSHKPFSYKIFPIGSPDIGIGSGDPKMLNMHDLSETAPADQLMHSYNCGRQNEPWFIRFNVTFVKNANRLKRTTQMRSGILLTMEKAIQLVRRQSNE
jgi:hypothetical protein